MKQPYKVYKRRIHSFFSPKYRAYDKTIVFDNDVIRKISLQKIADDFPYQKNNHPGDPVGQDYHLMYAYISTLFDGIKIADLGTRTGNSALAWSYNPKNKVDSYDINEEYYYIVKKEIKKKNVNFFLENIIQSTKMLDYHIICIDIDPHEGIEEKMAIDFLIANDWKGIVFMDDIGANFNRLMAYWNSITLPKWDITKYGHRFGNGIIDLTNTLTVEMR